MQKEFIKQIVICDVIFLKLIPPFAYNCFHTLIGKKERNIVLVLIKVDF